MRRLYSLLNGLRRDGALSQDEAAPSDGRQLILTDEPITDPDQDTLGRSHLVERICAALSAWPSNQPLVVALTGDWGEGKTSVFNLVVKQLRKGDQHIVVEFDPWFFNSAEALIQGFLTTMENAFLRLPESKVQGKVKKLWAKTRTSLSSLPSVSAFGMGVDFSNLRERAPALGDLREQVRDLSSSLGRKVVVVVDDLDRLQSDELLTVLKLVKLWNAFSGFLFLVAFDRSAVEAKLGPELEKDRRLLEKLVQVEIRLPKADAGVGRFVDVQLDKVQQVFSVRYEDDFAERLGRIWRSGMSRRISTLRSAKRYANAVAFAVPFVHGEVNYADLCTLEFLRLFYPGVYEALALHQDLFSGTSGEGGLAERERETRRTYHEELLAGLPTHEDRDVVKAALVEIFPLFAESFSGARYGASHLVEWSKQQRACAPDRCPVYFQYGVPEQEIPDTWVKALIGETNATDEGDVITLIRSAFDDMKGRGKLRRLLDRLVDFSSDIDRARARAFISAVLGGEKLYEMKKQAFEQSEFETAVRLVFGLAARFEDSPDIQDILGQVVAVGPLSFASEVLHFSDPRRNDVIRQWDHVNTESLRLLLGERFRRDYVDGGRNILAEESPWVSSRVLYEIGDKELVTAYLIRLFKSDPSVVPSFLARFVWRALDRLEFRHADMAAWIDVGALRAALRDLPVPSGESEDERFAVQEFFAELAVPPAGDPAGSP